MNDDPSAAESGPPPPSAPPTSPGPTTRRLRRASDGSLGGVASGLATYLGIDPVVVRIGFVVLTVVGSGVGLLLYLLGWALLPDDTDTDPRPMALNTSTPALVIGALLLAAAVSSTIGTIQFGIEGSVLVPLALVGGGIFLLSQTSAGIATAATPTSVPPPPTSSETAPPTHWATPVVDPEPPSPTEPKAPVTSVTIAIGALLVSVLLAFSQFTSLDATPAALFGVFAATCGVGLVVSAFIGRAGPLVPLGLLALLGMVAAPVAETTLSNGVGPREYRPATAAELQPSYEVGSGYIELDLRDLELLVDDAVTVDVGAGYVEILLPDDTNIDIDVASRAGYLYLLGVEQSGVRPELSTRVRGPEGGPTLTIDAKTTFGSVEVYGGR